MSTTLEQLEAQLVRATTDWLSVRRSGGESYANGQVDAARRALATHSESLARLREEPDRVIVVRVPRGAPRLRPSRITRKPAEL